MVSCPKLMRLAVVSVLLGLFTLLLPGCFGGGSPPSDSAPSGKSLVKVVVQWSEFGQTKAAKSVIVAPADITHVGARLEYPDNSAVFIQSVKKQVAQDVGVITMEVPAANKANLYVVAVKYDGTWKGNRALYFGVVRDLYIPGNTVIEVKMSDIQWAAASWHLAEEDEAIWNVNRIYETSASEQFLDRPTIYVYDPFQV